MRCSKLQAAVCYHMKGEVASNGGTLAAPYSPQQTRPAPQQQPVHAGPSARRTECCWLSIFGLCRGGGREARYWMYWMY